MAEQQIKQLIRIAGTDINGSQPLYYALCRIKGVGYSYSNAICNIVQLNKNKRIGDFSEEELKAIEDVIKNPLKHNIPVWMLNRRNDYETGQHKHLLTTDLSFTKDFDIKILKKIKAYRGMRHAFGQPVRGQRTRSHFRKGSAVGVKSRGKKGKVG